jgi:hypothetical protein
MKCEEFAYMVCCMWQCVGWLSMCHHMRGTYCLHLQGKREIWAGENATWWWCCVWALFQTCRLMHQSFYKQDLMWQNVTIRQCLRNITCVNVVWNMYGPSLKSLPWSWMQQVPTWNWYLSTRLHFILSEVCNLNSTMRSSHLRCNESSCFVLHMSTVSFVSLRNETAVTLTHFAKDLTRFTPLGPSSESHYVSEINFWASENGAVDSNFVGIYFN